MTHTDPTATYPQSLVLSQFPDEYAPEGDANGGVVGASFRGFGGGAEGRFGSVGPDRAGAAVSIVGRFVSWMFPPGPEFTVHEMCDTLNPGSTVSHQILGVPQWYEDLKIVAFLEARIGEMEQEDPDGATKCRVAIDNCCDRIDATGGDLKPVFLRGRINNMKPLRKLARNGADHLDFRPEWETP